MKGAVLAGTQSGVGKTVAALAIIQAFDQDGYSVQPAKAGPDFIDPSHHTAIADCPSRTLDIWLEGVDGARRNYYRGNGDFCVVEGVMGLYDGDCSSTAMVAEALDLPIILVVDAKAGMESVAATAHGFRSYASHAGRDIDVAGILAQRAHGGRHAEGIRDALPDEIQYFGRIPPQSSLSIPDRHLGLEMGSESPLDTKALTEAAETIHTEQIIAAARAPPRPEAPSEDVQSQSSISKTNSGFNSTPNTEVSHPRIAIADDSAFCFRYPATVELLNNRANVITFSPLADDPLPICDGVYLPGGYPELHGATLAESQALRSLADRATDGLPVLAECGGLMTLADSLTTTDGDTYEMAGVLPLSVQMEDRYQALDHVKLRADHSTLTADTGEVRKGHEFHYSAATVDSDARFAFTVERGDGIDGTHDGVIEYQTLATYCHLHPASGAFDTFIERVRS